jgi:hypothetical protein
MKNIKVMFMGENITPVYTGFFYVNVENQSKEKVFTRIYTFQKLHLGAFFRTGSMINEFLLALTFSLYNPAAGLAFASWAVSCTDGIAAACLSTRGNL